jgi:hypothetical protein
MMHRLLVILVACIMTVAGLKPCIVFDAAADALPSPYECRAIAIILHNRAVEVDFNLTMYDHVTIAGVNSSIVGTHHHLGVVTNVISGITFETTANRTITLESSWSSDGTAVIGCIFRARFITFRLPKPTIRVCRFENTTAHVY